MVECGHAYLTTRIRYKICPQQRKSTEIAILRSNSTQIVLDTDMLSNMPYSIPKGFFSQSVDSP